MHLSDSFRARSAFCGSLLWLAAGCGDQGADQAVDPARTSFDANVALADAAVPPGPDAGASQGSSGTLDASVAPAQDAARNATSDATVRTSADDAAAAGDAAIDAAGEAARDALAETGSGEAGSDAATDDPSSVASALNGLFVDVPCAPSTPTPLANGATCLHPGSTQHIEKLVNLGGVSSVVYNVKLRVRGIWEPTKIQGGERPDKAHPFTIGGMLPSGTGSSDAVSYQQYSIQVSEPKQTYWLNDHQYLAHDIHKEDYVATLRVNGGARVTVIMNDGNDHQIANWTKSYFADLPPYDKAPSTGQSLRLDVVSVTPAP